MKLFNLSLRHKLPIWGGLLILVTAVSLTLAMVWEEGDENRQDMLHDSQALAQTLANTLPTYLIHDDVWHAFEVIKAPFRAQGGESYFQIQDVIVLDKALEIFVSTRPERYPLQRQLRALGPEFAQLQLELAAGPKPAAPHVVAGAERLLLSVPIVANEGREGTLIMVHGVDFDWPRFLALAQRSAFITLLVLAVLLPINWYWARHMADPLVQLAGHMGEIGGQLPAPFPPNQYPFDDELGRLFKAYDRMFGELVEKEAMKQEMIRSERLAALGRLSAGIAHEINNPLGGLITAVDTLKRHAGLNPVAERVVPLLERGLEQIRAIVAALLVEARSTSHPLSRDDIEDIQTLLAQEMQQHGIHWQWHCNLREPVPIPATLVRQVLLNLLLNAMRAAGRQGQVMASILVEEGQLRIEVENDGKEIPPEVKRHLFEPFATGREGGHGLGLWVTYQIVQQLRGRIQVVSRTGFTRFLVTLPIGESL